MLSLSIGLNAVSAHGACTAVFLAVAGIVGFLFSSIKTLGRITWVAWVGLACILTAGNLLPQIQQNPQKQSTNNRSFHRNHRSRHPRPSRRRTARYSRPLDIRLQNHRQPILRRRHRRRLLARLCLHRHTGVLRHRGGNARAAAVHPRRVHLPGARHGRVYHGWMRGVLLLRVVCGVARVGICGNDN